MWYKDRGWDYFVRYIRFIKIVFIAAFFLIFFRVFQVQILKGFKFSEKSRENYLKRFIVPPNRGRIISADGQVIATTYISYDLVSQITPPEKLQNDVCAVTGVPRKILESSLAKSLKKGEILKTLIHDLKGRSLIAMASVINEYPNLRIIKSPKRFYPYEQTFSHVTGYLGAPLRSRSREMDYSYPGSLHGKSGIEKNFDSYLFGSPGGEIVEVSAGGDVIEVKGRVLPSTGDEIILTVDSRLQKTAYEAFQGRPGAAVALNPKTGAVLLFVSSPGFDPGAFGDDPDEVSRMMTSPAIPLVNRVIQMKYPPGSVFKIFTAAAALNEERIDTEKKIDCRGVFKYGNREFNCWKEEGHGEMNFLDGFSQSCNVYFYNTALEVGVKDLSKYAHMMGLDLNALKDISGELTATIPSAAWKKKRYKRSWLPGDTVNMGIGQGFLWVTPLQIALAVGGVANGGVIHRPYLVSKITTPGGKTEYEASPEQVKQYSLREGTFKILREALRKVVTDGTGRVLNIDGCEIYGKTGTAQNPSGDDHAWFVSFGGGDLEDFALTVVLEHGGKGSAVAGPVSRAIWSEYIKIKNEKI
ncbi:MAG: penicillin-binding protein 2 [Elusimicrobiota bacterium]|nr:penicillin-binding protein 2 [Elusimicrobiota bacterium]